MGSATSYYPWSRTDKVAQLFRVARGRLGVANDTIDEVLGVPPITPFAAYTDEHIRLLEMLGGPYGHAIMKMLRLKQNV